jgi:hypothetical protein
LTEGEGSTGSEFAIISREAAAVNTLSLAIALGSIKGKKAESQEQTAESKRRLESREQIFESTEQRLESREQRLETTEQGAENAGD